MKPDIAVLYGDLEIIRVSWGEKKSLRKEYVIAVAVIQVDNPRPHVRRQGVIEFDYYTLVWDDTSCYLGGYNDDMYWFNFENPHESYGKGFTYKFPFILPKNSILFEGVMIDGNLYQKAKQIFNDRKGGMY